MTLRLVLLLILVMVTPAAGAPVPGRSFLALCYHNVEDRDPDQTYVGVTTEKLVQQLDWLQGNGYHFISLSDVLAAHAGVQPLPDKAVLLTFDDGFESFYTRAFPILQAFRAPALLALTGVWLEGASDGTVQYGDRRLPRDMFLRWPQVREMIASGLVEVASHSWNLHRGIVANPQGNTEPAAVTRQFDAPRDAYESEAEYRARLQADTTVMVREIARETGKPPRAMVWPYGENNELALSVAAANGMTATFSLADAVATVDRLDAIPRHLITPDPSLDKFVSELRSLEDQGPFRVVQIDLDYVYDPDPAQEEHNLDRLVQRVQNMGISAVFLQAFADPDGSGVVRAVYFPNGELPMRADLFNRVSWQLRTRSRVKVFAWMPVLAFDFGDGAAAVTAQDPRTGEARIDPSQPRRLSPFDDAVRRRILALYEDLARAAPFEGILFGDDSRLSDDEDAGAAALAAYEKAGLPSGIAAIRADPETMQRWTRFKTEALITFTQQLADAVRHYRSPLLTARNIFAGPVLDPASESWFGQSFERFLAAYDYTAVLAMPQLEQVPADDATSWLERLVAAVAQQPEGLKRTVFELQAVDWRQPADAPGRRVPTHVLGEQMRLLQRRHALNFGYYPDDFLTDHPVQVRLHPDFSLQSYPYRP